MVINLTIQIKLEGILKDVFLRFLRILVVRFSFTSSAEGNYPVPGDHVGHRYIG